MTQSKRRMVLVDIQVLPDIVTRTLEAKRLLLTGEAANVSEATRMVGLSRTAFYKYRDAVMPYDEETAGRTVTVQLVLRHHPGVISRVLEGFAREGANILTVNQTTPSGGMANATVCARIDQLLVPIKDFYRSLEEIPGVERVFGFTDG